MYWICLQCGRLGFSLWVGKIPWRRKWQPTPVFLPEESCGQRILVDNRVGRVWATNTKILKSYRVCNYIRNQYQKIFENNPHIFKSNVTLTTRLWYFKQSAQSCIGSCCSWTKSDFWDADPASLCVIPSLWNSGKRPRQDFYAKIDFISHLYVSSDPFSPKAESWHNFITHRG